ncbi:MAG: hypothetical protein PHH26_06610 [Candidatus Thermoplasmatota archaeon]|nr:hypothetical protein [Candidatus Thermoplasmatota archaeon]
MRSMVLTVEELATAIHHKSGIPMEDAERNALFVMNLFGYDNRIIDNVLESEDRGLFYMLEEEHILTTEREEVTLYDGREWRTHYWVLNKDMITKLALGFKSRREDAGEQNVYEGLPPEAWVAGPSAQ